MASDLSRTRHQFTVSSNVTIEAIAWISGRGIGGRAVGDFEAHAVAGAVVLVAVVDWNKSKVFI